MYIVIVTFQKAASATDTRRHLINDKHNLYWWMTRCVITKIKLINSVAHLLASFFNFFLLIFVVHCVCKDGFNPYRFLDLFYCILIYRLFILCTYSWAMSEAMITCTQKVCPFRLLHSLLSVKLPDQECWPSLKLLITQVGNACNKYRLRK